MASGSLKRTLVLRGLDFTTQQTTSNDRFACLEMIRSPEKNSHRKTKTNKQIKKHTKTKTNAQANSLSLLPSKKKKRKEREREELIENLLWKTFRYFIFPFETNSVCLAINFVKFDVVEFVLTS